MWRMNGGVRASVWLSIHCYGSLGNGRACLLGSEWSGPRTCMATSPWMRQVEGPHYLGPFIPGKGEAAVQLMASGNALPGVL